MVSSDAAAGGRSRVTVRDGAVGAAVMVGGTVLLTGAGLAAEGRGWPAVAEGLTRASFPVALMLSLPFWLLKGRDRPAQMALVGGTAAALVAVSMIMARRAR